MNINNVNITAKIFITLIGLSLFGCGKNDTKIDDNPNLQIRQEAVDTLVIGSSSFVLEAYLWRDFMPASPENGQPMISINWLVNTDSVDIPDNIKMVKQYVFYGELIWEANYENEAPAPSLPKYKMEHISRNGPKWGPKIYVDVISQIYDSNTKKTYYLQKKDVYVARTD